MRMLAQHTVLQCSECAFSPYAHDVKAEADHTHLDILTTETRIIVVKLIFYLVLVFSVIDADNI